MGTELTEDQGAAVARVAHELGAAALFGGNLFARTGMHPALTRVSDPRERGAVVNAAWRRYGTINSLGLGAVLASWAALRARELADGRLGSDELTLARVKDGCVVAVAVTGVASAINGVRFARMDPEGPVPLQDGNEVAPEASEPEARAKRVLNLLGGAHLAATATLVVVNALLGRSAVRRPPLRRLVRKA